MFYTVLLLSAHKLGNSVCLAFITDVCVENDNSKAAIKASNRKLKRMEQYFGSYWLKGGGGVSTETTLHLHHSDFNSKILLFYIANLQSVLKFWCIPLPTSFLYGYSGNGYEREKRLLWVAKKKLQKNTKKKKKLLLVANVAASLGVDNAAL